MTKETKTMRDMVVLPSQLPAQPAPPQPMSRALARQTNHMQQIAAVAKLAMDEVSDVAGYSALKAANTVSFAALIKQAAKARGSAPAEEAVYDQLMESYLNNIMRITQTVSNKIVLSIENLPLEARRGVLEELCDELFGG